MYNGMRVYKAQVVSSSTTTGRVYVRIPSLLGATESIAVSRLNASDADTPAEGTKVLVAIEDSELTNVYLMGSGGGGPITGSVITDTVLQSPEERWTIYASAVPASLNIDLVDSSAVYYALDATGDWTTNFRGSSSKALTELLAIGDSITVVLAVLNGSTGYYSTGFTIDTTITPTVLWQGGTAPTSGNPNSVDLYAMSLLRTGESSFTILASQTKFA